MKKIILLFIASIAIVIGARTVSAQTISPASPSSSSAVGITFPIPQLGNCTSQQDCKSYCDDPTHIQACVDFAKQKGFYHQSTLDNQQAAVLADAKATLGCDSVTSCMTFCANTANATACTAFAQKHNLRGGTQQVSNGTLQKAIQVLGCSSPDSCRAFCQQDQNKEKCAAFAKENGLQGGNTTMGPGGCTSEDTCKVFCADPNNFQTCSRFVSDQEGSRSGRVFSGPGGCTSEASCQAFCQSNPTACHMMQSMPAIHSSGSAMPMNPEQGSCQGTQCPSPHPMGDCGSNPTRCGGVQQLPQNGQNQPSGENSQGSQSGGSSYPRPNYGQYCQSRGCSFNGTGCVCPSPAAGGQNQPSGQPPISPTGSVRGVSTVNFLQLLFQTFLNYVRR